MFNIEQLVFSECGHIWVDGQCFEWMIVVLNKQGLERMSASERDGLLWERGFVPNAPIESSTDIHTTTITFAQLKPVHCRQEHMTDTIEGLRAWMRAGCPS